MFKYINRYLLNRIFGRSSSIGNILPLNLFYIFTSFSICVMVSLFKEDLSTNAEKNHLEIALLSIIIYFLYSFFPSFSDRAKLPNPLWPITVVKRIIINLYYNFFSIQNLIVLLFSVISWVYLKFSILLISHLILNYLIGFLIVYNSRIALSKINLTCISLLLINIVILWILCQVVFFYNSALLFAYVSYILFQFYLLFIFETNDLFGYNFFTNQVSAIQKKFGIYYIIFSNSNSLKSFLSYVIIKIIFIYLTLKSNIPVFGVLGLSPLLLFTYFANNIWGFFKSILVSHFSNFQLILRSFFKILIIPIVVDLLTNIYFFSQKGAFQFLEVVYIFLTLITLIVISFFGSIIFPVEIKSNSSLLSFKIKSHIIPSLLSISSVYYLSQLYSSNSKLALYLFLFPICLLLIVGGNLIYSNKVYLFRRILKSNRDV